MLPRPSEIIALKAQEYGIPVLLLNQNENITEIGDFVFRNFVTKSEQARALAKFAVENLGIRRFGFLYPKHNYGIEFIESLWDELLKYPDIEVRGSESYESDANDFSEPIKKLVGLHNLNFRESEICTGEPLEAEPGHQHPRIPGIPPTNAMRRKNFHRW